MNEEKTKVNRGKNVYLTSNGVHLSIVIPMDNLSKELKTGLKIGLETRYIGFGWGEENFYLNTPTWNDLTFVNAFKASFLKNTTLIHVTRYRRPRTKWIEVDVSKKELNSLMTYVLSSFKMNGTGEKIILPGRGYTSNDDFYKANGRYSLFKTCNSWVNTGFKESGLKACLWTPFDFGLLRTHENTIR